MTGDPIKIRERREPRPLATSPATVTWLDVDPDVDRSAVSRALAFLPRDTVERLTSDVMEVDPVDRGVSSYDGGAYSVVHAVEVRVLAQKDELLGLVFVPVNVLVAGDVIITCAGEPRPVAVDGSGLREFRPPDVPSIRHRIEGLLKADTAAADVGAYIIGELALGFARAHREVTSWMEDWQLRLYRRGNLETRTLLRANEAITELRRYIDPLNLTGEGTSLAHGWFQGARDHDAIVRADKRIDRSLRRLRELAVDVRDGWAARRGVVEARRQRRFEYAAAVFLLPTLVATVYGANDSLPGANTDAGVLYMIATMIAVALISMLGVYLLNRRDNEP